MLLLGFEPAPSGIPDDECLTTMLPTYPGTGFLLRSRIDPTTFLLYLPHMVYIVKGSFVICALPRRHHTTPLLTSLGNFIIVITYNPITKNEF